MDQYMLYDQHVSYIIRKANGVLIFLNRIQDNFDRSTRTIVVQCLALSIINYCSKVWGMTTKEQLERVQRVLNFAAKIAYGGIRKYDHVTPILKNLQWINIEKKIEFDICAFIYKVINHMLPEWLFNFPLVGEMQTRPTRQLNNLVVGRTNTDIGARAISIKGPKVWNSIPLAIRNSPSIRVFKDKLKNHILGNSS